MTPLLALTLLACPHPFDPLAERREALVRVAPCEQPQAALVLGRPLVEEAVRLALDGGLSREVPGPLGIPVVADTSLGPPRVDLEEGTRAPVAASLALTGATQLRAGPLPLVSARWSARVGGEVGLAVRDEVVWVEPGVPWEVEATVAGLDPAMAASVQQVLTDEVRRGLSDAGLDGPLPVARSRVGPVRVERLDLSARGGLRVDACAALPVSGAPGPVPDPGSGWVAVLPEDTVLGVLDAALLGLEPDPDWVLEARDVVLAPGRLEVVVRVWRARERQAWRDLRVPLAIGVAEGMVTVDPTSVDVVGRQGRLGHLGGWLLTERRVERWLGRAVLPAERPVRLGRSGARLTLDEVRVHEGSLELRGSLVEAAPAP